ncbi:hypothetical protein TNCV_1466711 [Trichonephila clavipes]|nr:hypothetical protein TNCV_1466711 [Trichonephila clavipes]
MRDRAYCAPLSIRDHWGLRCMSKYPDQVDVGRRRKSIFSQTGQTGSSGHLPDFVCYDGNPRRSRWRSVNKTFYMAREKEILAGEVRRACRTIYQTTPSNPSPWIGCIQCTSHICA